jgi:16S rRNA (uracil1498-N3)-methyltransferase
LGDENFPYSPIRHPVALQVGEQIRFGRRAASALRFRQVNPKEAFTLQDSEGRFFRASLIGMVERGGEALVYEEMARSPESPLRLTLVCGILSRQRMLLIAQKATELGVSHLFPVFTEHSVGPEGLEHEKAHAWPKQALRAVRQCRRASVPEVHEAIPLAAALSSAEWGGAEFRCYLDDRGESPAALEPGPVRVCLAAGPEGGWSDPEREQLKTAGAAPLILGGRILRAETAVLAGLALIQYALGDLAARPDDPPP